MLGPAHSIAPGEPGPRETLAHRVFGSQAPALFLHLQSLAQYTDQATKLLVPACRRPGSLAYREPIAP
jgi:hypothetical protein